MSIIDHALKVAKVKLAEGGAADGDQWEDAYHGTHAAIDQFDLGKSGSGTTAGGKRSQKAIFLTSHPQNAATYLGGQFVNRSNAPHTEDVGSGVGRHYAEGANIMPLKVNTKDFHEWDYGGGLYDEQHMNQIIKEARKERAPGVVIRNIKDQGYMGLGSGKTTNTYVVLDPARIRSKFAKFDPKKAKKKDIMASSGGVIDHALRVARMRFADGGTPENMRASAARAELGKKYVTSQEGPYYRVSSAGAEGRRSVFGGVRPQAWQAAAADAEAGQTHPAWIPTRLVTSKDPNLADSRGIVDLASMKATPKNVFEDNVDLVRAYPNVTATQARMKSHDKLAEAFIQHITDNLLSLHDAVPEAIRQRSKLWYDGARAITDTWSKKYGLPDYSIAGALAALSPQKDWYQNVSLAERVLDAMRGMGGNFHKGFVATDDMARKLASIPSMNKEKYAPIWNMLRGKSLSDIDSMTDLSPEARARAKAFWIRLHDETYNERGHRIVTPEGGFGDYVRSAKGQPAKVGWGSLGEIAKAIQSVEAAEDPSKISELMGEQHKVRNFYNNILNPNSPNGDVTIDTHAVAAGLLRPLSGNSLEVAHNFKNSITGMPAARGSSITGIQGLYPLYAEAYRRAAKQREILPRQMQSITWEAVRGLFPDTFKTDKNNDAINAIWKQYRKGSIDQNEARRQVYEFAGGIRPPSWYVGGNGRADAQAPNPGNQTELSKP